MPQGKLTDYDDNSSTDTTQNDDTEQEESTGSADASERRDIPSPPDTQTVRDPPQIDSDGVPDKCISLTVESTWGHFKRVGRSNTKQTYRIPPRTTVAGLLASVVGSDRDSYYDVFAPDTSAIAITPLCDIRTINIPVTELGTDPGQSCVQKETSNNGVTLAYQDTTEPRQLHAYEVISDPKYRIDVAVEDADYYDELATKLENGESHYPPSLGRSEYLCSIANVDVTTDIERVTDTDTYSIDSIVPVEFNDRSKASRTILSGLRLS